MKFTFLMCRERNAFFLPAAAYEKRVTEIQHFVDQIECHLFHELIADDCQHHRHDQKRQKCKRVRGKALDQREEKNTARKPNQMTGKIRL